MEELFVYAILCGIGFEKYDKYEHTLERLLEWNPTDEMLLDLYGRKYRRNGRTVSYFILC